MRRATFSHSILSGAVLSVALSFVALSAHAGLDVFFSATGKIALSVDGAGSNNASHIIEVEKPNASATVVAAFLMAASNNNRVINNGDVAIDGKGVVWSQTVVNNAGNLPTFFFNALGDVLATVKPKVDAAAPGRVQFTLTELTTGSIDGEALVVVFDDPEQTSDNTVLLLFGGQDTNGDRFAISLSEPVDLDNGVADMGLGISFSFNPSGSQFSTIDVNGQRMTSAASNFDDGSGANGALITVGGLDDLNDNPADPLSNVAADDELYSLLPFLTATDTSILVDTANPSDDDNIFFAYFLVSGAAIVGEGIILSPETATNNVGEDHTVTARLVDDNGDPVVGRQVDFEVLTGPNAGDTGTDTTDGDGLATFTYTGDGGEGIDEIQASFIDSREEPQFSNVVTKEWILVVCDVDGNGQIDILDIAEIFLVKGEAVEPGDPRDFDQDGVITTADVRGCALICTNQLCRK